MHSWRVLLLPFMEHKGIYDAYDFSVPWNHPTNAALSPQMPQLYKMPGSDEGKITNYFAVIGPGTIWSSDSQRRSKPIRVLGNTVTIVENVDLNVNWMQPVDISIDDAAKGVGAESGITSLYDRVAVVTAAGTVLTLDENLSETQLRALLTVPDADEEIGELPSGVVETQDGRLRSQR